MRDAAWTLRLLNVRSNTCDWICAVWKMPWQITCDYCKVSVTALKCSFGTSLIKYHSLKDVTVWLCRQHYIPATEHNIFVSELEHFCSVSHSDLPFLKLPSTCWQTLITTLFGISKSAWNTINVTWRFLFSSASVKLNWATTSLLLLPSPHPSPCSLQDVVFLCARCYKHSSENKTALWFHPHLLQASLTAPGNCSGTTNCCRALHRFTNTEKLCL